jgi:hypothetical protein
VQTRKSADILEGYLADPQGNPLSDSDNLSVVDSSHLPALEIYREHPQAGTWHFVLSQNSLPGANMEGVNPTTILPGATGVIQVTITPDPSQLGKTISGYLYVDTLGVSEGSEVVRIPYSYTVGP